MAQETEYLEKLAEMQIVKVSFPKPMKGKTEWYFGCLTAIYDVFTSEEIGVKLTTLQAKKWEFKSTSTCSLQRIKVLRKRHVNRRKSNKDIKNV